MTQNRYLEILELQPGATRDDVKKAYRRLSKVYHPDISKDPNAHQRFIEITEAYQFLTKLGPQPQQESIAYDYNPEVAEYEHWRAWARERARKKAREAARLQHETIRKTLKVMRVILFVIAGFNALLAVDYLLPRRKSGQHVVNIQSTKEQSRGRTINHYGRVTFDDYTMLVPWFVAQNVEKNSMATVEATMIFDKPMKAELTVPKEQRLLHQVYNVYIVFGYLIPGILILFLIYEYGTRILDTKLTIALFEMVAFLIQLYFFLSV